MNFRGCFAVLIFERKVIAGVFLALTIGFGVNELCHAPAKGVKTHFVDNLAKAYVTGCENSCFDQAVACDQPFSYIGNGCQSVAFESFDKKFVLKFFTLKPFYEVLRLENDKSNISSSWKKNYKRKKRLESVLKNYNRIFQKKPDLAGLVSARLTSNEESLPEVVLQWPDGSSAKVSLSDYFFVIQKKSDLVLNAIEACESLVEKQRKIESMRNFLVERAKAGFRDRRKTMSMHMNYGFFQDSPLQFDVGNVVFDSEVLKNPENEIENILELFDGWVEANQQGLGL